MMLNERQRMLSELRSGNKERTRLAGRVKVLEAENLALKKQVVELVGAYPLPRSVIEGLITGIENRDDNQLEQLRPSLIKALEGEPK